jgi:hypothetical protein
MPSSSGVSMKYSAYLFRVKALKGMKQVEIRIHGELQ